MISDLIKLTGELHIVLRDQYGNIKDERVVPNLVVTTGKYLLARRLAGVVTGTSATPSHMGVGSSSVAADVSNTSVTALGSRVALNTITDPGLTNVVTMSATFIAGVGTGAITEAGIFNALTGGVMLCRTVFATVNKAAGDVLTINWAITIN